MANINAGTYTVRQVFEAAGFNFAAKAAADYNEGAPDFRRVKVGGLGFDDLEDKVVIPVTADFVSITVDGAEDGRLTVNLSDVQVQERRLSFDSAVEASDS